MFYAERLALYSLNILHTQLQCVTLQLGVEENKKLRIKIGRYPVTNPTLVYLEQLLPIPALAAGDRLGDVVNDLHLQDVCRAIHEIRGQK